MLHTSNRCFCQDRPIKKRRLKGSLHARSPQPGHSMQSGLRSQSSRMTGRNRRVSYINKAVCSARWRQKCVQLHLQGTSENHQLRIGHTTDLRLNLGKGSSANVPTNPGASGGEHLLRQPVLVSDFSDLWPDDVLSLRHAPVSELDSRGSYGLNCSEIGANALTQEGLSHGICHLPKMPERCKRVEPQDLCGLRQTRLFSVHRGAH